ncbi:CheW protein [Desulfonatronum zhilinae]|nr:CheW protein [Desulfonatronum zhilinae]
MQDDTATVDRKRAILRERAKLLARRVETPESQGPTLDIVEFILARERYAVESIHVREVLPLRDPTPVPCTPAFVHGIVNIRGKILSVIDLRLFFDLPRSATNQDKNQTPKVVVLASQTMSLGILAEALVGAGSVPLANLNPPLPNLEGVPRAYLRGVLGPDLILLDALKLLNDPAIVVNEEP